MWAFLGISSFVWIYISFNSKGFDKSVLKSDSSIEVKISADYISFVPQTMTSKATIFFYPGALVDPFAYAPLCKNLSVRGFETIIVRMPWRMATKGYKLIKERHLLSENKRYVIIGHSQGGKMAAQFVFENPNTIDNLILLGTTHPRDIDLSNTETHILKIYGSNDEIARPNDVIMHKSKLPMNTEFYEIKGGNHSQFGYYGCQLGDGKAKITREEQFSLITKEILVFLENHAR